MKEIEDFDLMDVKGGWVALLGLFTTATISAYAAGYKRGADEAERDNRSGQCVYK